MPMRNLTVVLLTGLLVASPAAQAGGKSRPRLLWDEPAGTAVITLFPVPDTGHRRERRPGRRALSLWDERPAPLQPAAPLSSPLTSRGPAPISWNSRIVQPDRGAFIPAAADRYRPLVERHATRFGLPPALIFAVIHIESSFNPAALSPRNAQGLMQLVPHKGGVEALRYITGDAFATPPTPQQLSNPDFNILLGTAYLRLVLDDYIPAWLPWEVRRDLALAAYNWGPDRVTRYLIGTNPPGAVAEVRARLERSAPAETREYVRRVNERLALYGSDRLAVTGWNFSAAHSH